MKRTLIVIDMQRDFIDGALGTPEAQAIVLAVREKISTYRKRGDEIIFTRDTHGPDYLSTPEGRKLPVEHCLKGTPGWELASGLWEPGEKIIDKPTFGSRILAEKIAAIAAQEEVEVTLIGLCTDICVVSNALLIKAYLPETPVKVIASCCAGVTPASHEAALTTMKMCQVEVI